MSKIKRVRLSSNKAVEITREEKADITHDFDLAFEFSNERLQTMPRRITKWNLLDDRVPDIDRDYATMMKFTPPDPFKSAARSVQNILRNILEDLIIHENALIGNPPDSILEAAALVATFLVKKYSRYHGGRNPEAEYRVLLNIAADKLALKPKIYAVQKKLEQVFVGISSELLSAGLIACALEHNVLPGDLIDIEWTRGKMKERSLFICKREGDYGRLEEDAIKRLPQYYKPSLIVSLKDEADGTCTASYEHNGTNCIVEDSQWAMASFALSVSLKDPRIETEKLFSNLGGVNSYLTMNDFSQPQKNQAWQLFPYLSCLRIWLTELLDSRNHKIPLVELLSVPGKTGDLLVSGDNQTLQGGLLQSQHLDRQRLVSGLSVELGVPLITFNAGGDVVSDWEIEGRPNWAIAFPVITNGMSSFVLYASGILSKDAQPNKVKVFTLLTAFVSCIDKLLKSVSDNTEINSLLPITFIRAPIEKNILYIGFADDFRTKLRNLSVEAAKAAQINNASHQFGPCKRMTVITVATHFTPDASDRQRETVMDSLPWVVWRITKHFPKIKAEAYEMSTYNEQHAVAILFPEPMTIEEIAFLRNQILGQMPEGRLDIYAPASMIEGREQAIGEIGVRLLNYSTKHLSQEWHAVGLRWLGALNQAIHEDLQENNSYKLFSSIRISDSNREADDPERWAQRLSTDVKATITIMPLLYLIEQDRRKHNYLTAIHTWDQAVTELAGVPVSAYLYRLKAEIMTEKSLYEDNPKLAWEAAEASLKALLADPSAPRYWYCLANSLLLTTDTRVLRTAEICLEALKEIDPSYRRRWLLEAALQWIKNRPTQSTWNTAIGSCINEHKTDLETARLIEHLISSRLDTKPFVSLDHPLLPVVLRQLRLLEFRSAVLNSQIPSDSNARQKSNNN